MQIYKKFLKLANILEKFLEQHHLSGELSRRIVADIIAFWVWLLFVYQQLLHVAHLPFITYKVEVSVLTGSLYKIDVFSPVFFTQ